MKDIVSEEVSLVKRPANRREFLVTKGENRNMEELLQAVLETEAQNEADLIKSLEEQDLDEKSIEVAKGIARLASAYSDEFNRDTFAAIAKTLGFELSTEREESADDGGSKPTISKSQLQQMDPDTRSRVESLLKSNEELSDTVSKLAERLDKSEDEKRLAEYVEKASTYTHVNANSEELGEILKSIADQDSDLATKVEELIAAANKQVEKAELFSERGSSRPGASDVLTEVDSQARELMKSDSNLSLGKARDQVLRTNRELAARYHAEVRNVS